MLIKENGNPQGLNDFSSDRISDLVWSNKKIDMWNISALKVIECYMPIRVGKIYYPSCSKGRQIFALSYNCTVQPFSLSFSWNTRFFATDRRPLQNFIFNDFYHIYAPQNTNFVPFGQAIKLNSNKKQLSGPLDIFSRSVCHRRIRWLPFGVVIWGLSTNAQGQIPTCFKKHQWFLLEQPIEQARITYGPKNGFGKNLQVHFVFWFMSNLCLGRLVLKLAYRGETLWQIVLFIKYSFENLPLRNFCSTIFH